MDLTKLNNTMVKVNKEYLQAVEAHGKELSLFIIDAKDLVIILEAAGYYYDKAQEERG